MVPVEALPPTVPSTLHVTPRFEVFPVTVGVNCWVCVVTTTAAICGERLTVTFGTATVRLMLSIWDKLPDVPVVVTVAFPSVAVSLAVSVIVLVLVVAGGLNDAVTPLGKPDTDKLTLPVNPFCPVTVIVLVAVPPWPTIGLAGDAARVKLGAGVLPPPPPHPAKASVVIKAVQKPTVPTLLGNKLC